MTPYEPSTEDVELVAAILDRWTEERVSFQPAGFYPSDRDNATEAVLGALFKAGRLLPSGGEARVERGWWSEADQDVQRYLSYGANGLPYRPPDRVRTVTSYSSGPIAEVVGRWEEVE